MKKLVLRRKRKREEVEEEVDLTKAERSVCYSGQEWVRGRFLGKGGFGCVNTAHFPNPKTPKFLKMPAVTAVKSARMPCDEELAREKEILDRFKDCPYIVRCLGDDVTYAEDNDDDQLVLNVFLELASGGTLLDLIKSSECRSGLPEQRASCFTKSILGGLNRIHQEGFVHCDLKLENVLLFKQDDDFVAKVADLGLTQTTEEIGVGRECGTRLYWALEILTGGIQCQASDIWALGCVVLAMLTGTLQWVDRDPPILPCGIFSDSAEDFLYKCFRRDPLERPAAATLLSHPFVSGVEDHAPLNTGVNEEEYEFIAVEASSSEEESSDDDGDDDDFEFLLKSPRMFKKFSKERPVGFPVFGY